MAVTGETLRTQQIDYYVASWENFVHGNPNFRNFDITMIEE
jgi:hypothetical protein